jgi:hypothetical protein
MELDLTTTGKSFLKYFFQDIELTTSKRESKSVISSLSANNKYILFPTLDHKFILGTRSISHEKVKSLSVTS